jgi:hypothetical protein
VERVVLNALAKNPALPLVFRFRRFPARIVFGEAKPPFANATVYRNFSSSFTSAKVLTANSPTVHYHVRRRPAHFELVIDLLNLLGLLF